jgi:hypothetical protein
MREVFLLERLAGRRSDDARSEDAAEDKALRDE